MDAIRFSSKAGANITMERELALRMIRMMGHSGSVPGSILAEDMKPALDALRQHLKDAADDDAQPESGGEVVAGDDDEDEDEDEKISLSTRAFPLLQLLQSAERKKQNLLWERFTGVYI